MGKGDYNFFASSNEKDVLDDVCPKLSYEQRLWGFCICAGIGWFMSFCAFISFFQGNLTTFAIVFTFGNMVAIMRYLNYISKIAHAFYRVLKINLRKWFKEIGWYQQSFSFLLWYLL